MVVRLKVLELLQHRAREPSTMDSPAFCRRASRLDVSFWRSLNSSSVRLIRSAIVGRRSSFVPDVVERVGVVKIFVVNGIGFFARRPCSLWVRNGA